MSHTWNFMAEWWITKFQITTFDLKFLLHFDPMLRNMDVNFCNFLRKAFFLINRCNKIETFYKVNKTVVSQFSSSSLVTHCINIPTSSNKNNIQHHMKFFPNTSIFCSGCNCGKYFSPFLLPPFSKSWVFSMILCHCE